MSKKNSTRKPIETNSSPVNQTVTPVKSSFNWFWICVGILVISVFIAFSGGFDNSFVEWDDNIYITFNDLIQHPTGQWAEAWNTHVALNYHPLTITSMMINSSIWGVESARSFIVTNTIIHIFNVLLVFWFVLLLLKKKEETSFSTSGSPLFIAFFTALIFAIHPMKVESVIWVSERKDVLYSFFFLGGCITYLKYLDSEFKIKYLIYSMLLFILSCLSKGQAVVLPVVFLLLDYWRDRKFTAKIILEKIPFLALSILFGLIATSIQGGGDFHGMIHSTGLAAKAIDNSHSLLDGFKHASYGFMSYCFNLFLPLKLSSLYPYIRDNQGYQYNYTLGVLFSLIVAAVTIISLKRNKLVFFGFAFFGITFATVSQILQVGGAIMADRYTYLPYIGVSFMLFSLIAKFIEGNSSKKSIAIAGISLFTIFLVFISRKQVEVWQNTGSLMRQRIEIYPDDHRAHFGVAKYAGEVEKDYDLSLSENLKAIETGYNYDAGPWSNLATAYYMKGDKIKALEYYDKTIAKEPKSENYMNRGLAYLNYQQPDKALPDLEKAIALPYDKSKKALLFGSLATAQLNTGKIKEALVNYNISIDKEGSQDVIHFYNRGVARLQLGDKEGAIADMKKCLTINPDYQDAKKGLQILGVK
jgi:protein O-mannosyl-transferase